MTDKKPIAGESGKQPADLSDEELERARGGTGAAGQGRRRRDGPAGITLDVDSNDTIET